MAFDMAGTTIDEGDLVYAVLRRVTEDAGAQYDDATFVEQMGTEKHGAVSALLDAGGVDAGPQLVDEVHARFVNELTAAYQAHPPRAFAGIEDAFAALRADGIKVALTTGFDRPTVDLLFTALGWSVPTTVDFVVCATEVAGGRPAPDMILAAMAALDVTEHAAVIAVGDTPADLWAAHHAGAVGVGVLTGAADRDTLAAQPHHALLGSAAEIVELVRTRRG